jgi:NADPH:quinone reductase-like Zn-dependent oxidoreductase
MMKAVVAHEYGAPEVLKFEQVPRPEPKDDEALVHVIASGVNPADPLTLSGKYAQEWGTHLPLIPGYDIAGVVEKSAPRLQPSKQAMQFTVTQLSAVDGQSSSRSRNGK